MKLIYKQLFHELIKGKVFLVLLLLLAALTSLSYFFVTFSVDGNMTTLESLHSLNENQQLYRQALESNTILAYNFFASLTGLTSFVIILFFYRFFRANKMQIGCIKALGFKDRNLRLCFMAFIGGLTFIGTALGLVGGYFLSNILIDANTKTYAVTGLVKGVNPTSLIFGLLACTIIFCIVTFFCYGFVKGKEPGALLAGNMNPATFSAGLKFADKLCKIAPTRKRLSLRIALRKPLAVVLIFIAVMAFTVFIVIGRSLNISSDQVYKSQTIGHNYQYTTQYSTYQTSRIPKNAVSYLETPVTLTVDGSTLERTVSGLYHLNNVLELENADGDFLALPKSGTVIIGPELSEVYNVIIGATLTINIAGKLHSFIVSDVAINASTATIYVNGEELADMLNAPSSAYNGVFSMEQIDGGQTTTKAERIDDLERNAVSNQVSGIINQATGLLVGVILIFLAIYINFQDNTHDMLILNMMGHKAKEIRQMLIDVYRPISIIAFALMLAPSILLAKAIQRMLSISTNDYMPFGTNIIVILIAFIAINVIYWLVQQLFALGIRRTVAKTEITELVYSE